MRFLPFAALLLVSIGIAHASFNHTPLLQSYNVSSALISSLHPVYMNYSGMQYVALYRNGSLYLLVNESTDSFVTGTAQISTIITPSVLQRSYSLADFPALYSMMQTYQQGAAPALADCINVTGLSRGLTCTLANYCQSCSTVPSCNLVLYNTGGPSGTLGQGIMTFEQQYYALNSSFNAFYSNIKGINASSAPSRLGVIESSFNNISSITSTIYQNPIFPPLATSPIGQCTYYPPSSMPWYCTALGYCKFLNYNYTLLASMTSRMNYIESLNFTQQQINAIAYSANATERSYITGMTAARQTALYKAILSTTLANYSNLVNSSLALLGHVSNMSVENALINAQDAYANLSSNYLTLNLTSFNKTISAYISRLRSSYSALNATYASMLALSRNNTGLLLKAQLNQKVPSQGIENLAFSQLGIDQGLTGHIKNASQTYLLLQSINKYAKSAYSSSVPMTLAGFVRAFDSPFVQAVEPPSASYSPNVSGAPLAASLLSLIIGVVLFALLYLFYAYEKARRRIRITRRTLRAWHLLFFIVAVMVILYIAATYASASSANSFTPESAFLSAISNAHNVAILVNGTVANACAGSVKSELASMDKNATTIEFSPGTDTCFTGTESIANCMSYYASHSTPMVILEGSNSSGISLYSFYGTYIAAHGNESFMNSCYPTLLLK